MLLAHRLALQCGRLDAEQVLRELSWRQIRLWLAYWQLEPWGDPYGPASLAAWAALVPWSKDATLTPADLHPRKRRPAEPADPDVLKRDVRAAIRKAARQATS